MLRKRFPLLCLLFLGAFELSGAQRLACQNVGGSAQANRSGTWSANASNGLTLMGTWTAVPDSTGRAVTGTWTIVDGQGRTLANGAWSAAKAPTRWTGAWRAIVSGRAGEYSGTWSSDVELKGDARFADLFEKAVQTVVSGNWRAGNRSGAWSIRAAEREGNPLKQPK